MTVCQRNEIFQGKGPTSSLHYLFKIDADCKNINSKTKKTAEIKCMPIRTFEYLNVHKGGAGANFNAYLRAFLI